MSCYLSSGGGSGSLPKIVLMVSTAMLRAVSFVSIRYPALIAMDMMLVGAKDDLLVMCPPFGCYAMICKTDLETKKEGF